MSGPPLIVSTTLDAPIINGRYQLKVGLPYTATVNVESGTISYLVRLESSASASGYTMSPTFRDDTINHDTGFHSYTFTITPQTSGFLTVAFQLRDRGTGNVFDVDSGVAVEATLVQPPTITSTTIAANIVNGRYLLINSLTYTVTVQVASGEVANAIRLEAGGLSSTMTLAPTFQDDDIPAGTSPRTYTFELTPNALGDSQVAFQLRDRGTGNVFNVDSGVAVTVLSAAPQIVSTTIEEVTPTNGQYELTVGERYTVLVRVNPGAVTYNAAVVVNDQLAIPQTSVIHDSAPKPVLLVAGSPTQDFRFSLIPLAGGDHQLGFMLRDAGTGNAFGYDGGVHVALTSPATGILGVVTDRAGNAISGATVALDGATTVTSVSDGSYRFPSPGAGKHQVRFSKPGYSPALAVNVAVPASGITVDADLRPAFPDLIAAGIDYTMYIDYAFGRTLLHVVRLPRATVRTDLLEKRSQPFYDAEAASRDALVTINGGYFDPADGMPVGYYYPNQLVSATPLPGTDPSPVLGIVGTGANQMFQIVEKSKQFVSNDWQMVGSMVLWDEDANGMSDVSFGLQADPMLLRPSGEIPAIVVSPGSDYLRFWPRTAVGVDMNGDLMLVCADGEGFDSYQGASLNELGELFRDLGARSAMNFDGGGSTQMVLQAPDGPYLVNTITNEHPDRPAIPARVANFLRAFAAP